MASGVLILVELQGDAPSRGSLGAIAAGRDLARALDGTAAAVCFGQDAADAAARYLPVVYQVELPGKDQESRLHALDAMLAEIDATALLLPATRTNAAVAPRIALRHDGSYLEDVTGLGAREGAVVATRLTQLQRVGEELLVERAFVVATVKAGAFEAAQPYAERGEVRRLEASTEAFAPRVEVLERPGRGAMRVGLEEAEVVVAGGRGVGGEDAFATLVVPLAERLGGAVGATRAVVDAGWRPYEEQIGQTGKTVAPRLYLALGVSGAVQHLSGMNRSRCIVAVNRDADAPIFKHCDVGVVADVHELVPALLEALGSGGG